MKQVSIGLSWPSWPAPRCERVVRKSPAGRRVPPRPGKLRVRCATCRALGSRREGGGGGMEASGGAGGRAAGVLADAFVDRRRQTGENRSDPKAARIHISARRTQGGP